MTGDQSRFDGISRTDLVRLIGELEAECETLKAALQIALRDGRQYLETLTRAQESGNKLQIELQTLKATIGLAKPAIQDRGSELAFRIQALESSGLSVEEKSALIAGAHIKCVRCRNDAILRKPKPDIIRAKSLPPKCKTCGWNHSPSGPHLTGAGRREHAGDRQAVGRRNSTPTH
jgi:hypothetical protein